MIGINPNRPLDIEGTNIGHSNLFVLTNSYFSLTYYYSDKEINYRIPYQNK